MIAIRGVYYIRNTKNGRVYIGSSVNIQKRIAQHISQLRRNKHPNPRLTYDWQCDGEEAFEHGVVLVVSTEYSLEHAEQYYLDHFKSYMPNRGYNQTNKSTGPIFNRLRVWSRKRP